MSSIYVPSEDSFFLSEFVGKEIEKLSQKPKVKLLDMGSGSGIQGEVAIKSGIKKENLTLVDINSQAIKFLNQKFPESNVVRSNLFKNVVGKFDLVIFNPPYLPKDKYDKKADTTGGEKGSGVINEFFKQAKDYLKEDGKILVLTSNFTKGINWLDYKKKLLGKKRIFFEELYVWELIN